jgi:hypothetical protein
MSYFMLDGEGCEIIVLLKSSVFFLQFLRYIIVSSLSSTVLSTLCSV